MNPPEIKTHGNTIHVDLMYPPYTDDDAAKEPDRVRFVEVDMCSVRAADGLRLSYDFQRDGWKIEQAQFFEWDSDDTECDPGWIEVAFIKAWANQKRPCPAITHVTCHGRNCWRSFEIDACAKHGVNIIQEVADDGEIEYHAKCPYCGEVLRKVPLTDAVEMKRITG